MTLKVFLRCLSRDAGNAGCDTTDTSDAEPDDSSVATDAEEGGGRGLVEMVEACLRAEQTPPTLTKVYTSIYTVAMVIQESIRGLSYPLQYREKLLWMEKLKYNPQNFNPLPPFAYEVRMYLYNTLPLCDFNSYDLWPRFL